MVVNIIIIISRHKEHAEKNVGKRIIKVCQADNKEDHVTFLAIIFVVVISLLKSVISDFFHSKEILVFTRRKFSKVHGSLGNRVQTPWHHT